MTGLGDHLEDSEPSTEELEQRFRRYYTDWLRVVDRRDLLFLGQRPIYSIIRTPYEQIPHANAGGEPLEEEKAE